MISSPSGTAAVPAARPAAATAADLPKLNVAPNCQAQSDRNNKTLEACLADEQHAREQVALEWGEFTRADKTHCTQLASTMGGGQSYIELLTCLEMARDAKKLPKDITEQ